MVKHSSTDWPGCHLANWRDASRQRDLHAQPAGFAGPQRQCPKKRERRKQKAPRRLLEIFSAPCCQWLRTLRVRIPSSHRKHHWTLSHSCTASIPRFPKGVSCPVKKYTCMFLPLLPSMSPGPAHPSSSGNKASLQTWAPLSKNSLQRKGHGYFWMQNYKCWVRVFIECHASPPKENRGLIIHLGPKCFWEKKFNVFFAYVTLGTKTLETCSFVPFL